MTSLYKHLRVHQIFGANTDVGKTILTTALSRCSAQRGKTVLYLKPISTGPLKDADDLHIRRHTEKSGRVETECLFRYDDPVSPHLAVKRKGGQGGLKEVPLDETVISSIANRIRTHAMKISGQADMYIETAGGVHSPTLSGVTQVDFYRPLFLPTILIGDSKLGGISSTISAYESLLLRGYNVDAVLLFRDSYYENADYLKSYFEERDIFLGTTDQPPPLLPDASDNFTATAQYYDSTTDNIMPLLDHLDTRHQFRLKELESMPRRTLDTIWWPFVQHGLVKGLDDVTVIDSAHADFFSVAKRPAPQSTSKSSNILKLEFDGSASWWTQTVGHAHPSLTLAAAKAAGRYGHVMFPLATHLPALKLAERLVHDGPGKGWASRAFFSDDGSTAMEVALKMALRAFSIRQGGGLPPMDKKRLGILGLRGSYHGDTIGAMDACEEGVYTCEWHNAKGYWFEPPTIGIKDGEASITIPASLSHSNKSYTVPGKTLSSLYDVEGRIDSPLARAYSLYITRALEALQKRKDTRLAALVLEPIVMGAGGMLFVDPLFQRVLVDNVRGRRSGVSSNWSGMPVIFDEVFVGLNRLGFESSSSLLGVFPDISVNAKILTGGLVPMAVTLANKSIFEAFLSDSKAEALLHGHSYTAHPIGCEVALETLRMIDKLSSSDGWASAKASWAKFDGVEASVWSLWDRTFVKAVSELPQVKETMALGSLLSIKVQDSTGGYTSHSAQNIMKSLNDARLTHDYSPAPGGEPYGVHYRTLGDVAYFITSLNTSSAVIRSLEDRIWSVLALP